MLRTASYRMDSNLIKSSWPHFLSSTNDLLMERAQLLLHWFSNVSTIWHQSPPPHHNRFTALFPGPSGWASARRELLDFMVQGKINRGRHTDHPYGRHSIRTKQCPPPPSPIFFMGWMPFLPLLIFPCTMKFRNSLLASTHLGGPGKRAVKWL